MKSTRPTVVVFFLVIIVIATLSMPHALSAQPTAPKAVRVNPTDLRSLGLSWDLSKPLDVTCPADLGDGYTPSFSTKFLDDYKKRGFTKEALCLAFASENVIFNPISGKPIPRYVVRYDGKDWDSGPYPFYLPDCFKSVRVMERQQLSPELLVKIWKPTGCKHVYHFAYGSLLPDAEGNDYGSTGTPDSEGGSGDEIGSSAISNSRLERLLSGGR